MGEELKGITIIDTIRPKNTESDYATHQSTYGKGGWHEVNTIDERNSIISSRRTNGMAVFVTETQKLYTLNAQDITVTKLTDADWNQFTLSGDMSVSSLNVNGTISAKNIQTTQNISANNYFFNNGDNVSTLITSVSTTTLNNVAQNYVSLNKDNTIDGNLKSTKNISANAYYITNVGNITLLSTTAINTITGSYLKNNYLALTGGTITGNLKTTGNISANSLSLVNKLTASEITLNNSSYSTVQAALDKLLYQDFVINTFTMSPNTTTMYVGDKLTNLIFNWSYAGTNTTISLQSLKLGNTQLTNNKTLRTYTYSNIISASTPSTFTFSLNATNSQSTPKTKSQNKTIAAVNYDLYFGTNENASFQSLILTSLTQVKTIDGRYKTTQTIPFTTTTAQYIYFAIPKDLYSSIEITADGFSFNNYSFNCTKVKTFTSTGCNITYNVYRFKNTLLGSTTCIFTLS